MLGTPLLYRSIQSDPRAAHLCLYPSSDPWGFLSLPPSPKTKTKNHTQKNPQQKQKPPKHTKKHKDHLRVWLGNTVPRMPEFLPTAPGSCLSLSSCSVPSKTGTIPCTASLTTCHPSGSDLKTYESWGKKQVRRSDMQKGFKGSMAFKWAGKAGPGREGHSMSQRTEIEPNDGRQAPPPTHPVPGLCWHTGG